MTEFVRAAFFRDLQRWRVSRASLSPLSVFLQSLHCFLCLYIQMGATLWKAAWICSPSSLLLGSKRSKRATLPDCLILFNKLTILSDTRLFYPSICWPCSYLNDFDSSVLVMAEWVQAFGRATNILLSEVVRWHITQNQLVWSIPTPWLEFFAKSSLFQIGRMHFNMSD